MTDDKEIVKILETYFSDANLLWDKILSSKIAADPEGYVSFKELSQLPNFKKLDITPEEIKSIPENLLFLQVEGDKVKRVKPFIAVRDKELDEYSVYVEGLKSPYVDQHNITQLFLKLVGHVSYVRVPEESNIPSNIFCFVEFDAKERVDEAVQIVNTYPSSQHPEDMDPSIRRRVDGLKLRVMSKFDWMALDEEYKELLGKRKREAKEIWDAYLEEKVDTVEEGKDSTQDEEMEEVYEKGVIVFVDNLHPQSTKSASVSLLQKSGVNIAFCSLKKKGVACVHVRLETPKDAQILCKYFNTHPTVQREAKDITGEIKEEHGSDTVKTRLISGKEEEIYWLNDKR
ncbi:hypothetical protein BDB01DRAFT_842667 [Pilobolus umbonatus]|nr:hypothetical protein BDB01DRAFT_842667 [Pilobolus umbonatus]